MAGLAALGRTLRTAFVAGLAMASLAAPALAQPALWAVKDADSTIYFLGTVHLLKPETQWHTERLDAAIAESGELWLELPTTNPEKMAGEMMALVARYGMSPGKRLSADLSAEEMKTLDEAAKLSGMTAAQLDFFRPWFAAITISTSAITHAGYDPTSGVDSKIEAIFGERGIFPKGLETAEQQIKVFAGMTREAELDYLRQTIEDYEKAPVELDRMVVNWSSGDTAAMEEMFVTDMKEGDAALYDALLTNRNANWVVKVEEMLKGSGTIFIAVGAGHLIGPDSVIAMLDAKGIKAERVQ